MVLFFVIAALHTLSAAYQDELADFDASHFSMPLVGDICACDEGEDEDKREDGIDLNRLLDSSVPLSGTLAAWPDALNDMVCVTLSWDADDIDVGPMVPMLPDDHCGEPLSKKRLLEAPSAQMASPQRSMQVITGIPSDIYLETEKLEVIKTIRCGSFKPCETVEYTRDIEPNIIPYAVMIPNGATSYILLQNLSYRYRSPRNSNGKRVLSGASVWDFFSNFADISSLDFPTDSRTNPAIDQDIFTPSSLCVQIASSKLVYIKMTSIKCILFYT